jgi:hypothetical protein
MSTQSDWNQRSFVALGALLSGLKYLRAAGGRAGALRRLPARETVAAAGIVVGVLVFTVVHALAEG